MNMQSIKRWLLLVLCAVTGFPSFGGEAITYYHNDLVGSPVAATDEAGYVRWRAAYRPYGDRDQTFVEQLASADNKKWFTGHVHDEETGLTYAGARYYEPTLGRFISVDPVGFKPENEQSFGRYTYANNNPYRYLDPTGREAATVSLDLTPGGYKYGTPEGDADVRGVATAFGRGLAVGAAVGSVVLPGPEDLVLAGVTSRAAGQILGNAARELSFGRKLDFLFNKNIDQSNVENAARAAGNHRRIGIADTPANRDEVIRRFNEAYRDPSSIVGPGKVAEGSNLREFFLPGVTGTGSKIQFVELNGQVITIIAK